MTDKKGKTNIRAIRPDVAIEAKENEEIKPDESVITLCTTLLDLAKEGYIQELNYTAGYFDGSYDSGSMGDCENEDGICAELMRMAIARSQMGIMLMQMEEDDFE
jgi:hypothetical protein